MRRKIGFLLLILAALLLCSGAAAEEEPVRIKKNAVLNHAFTVLEKGTPFVQRYNRIKQKKIRARLKQGPHYL